MTTPDTIDFELAEAWQKKYGGTVAPDTDGGMSVYDYDSGGRWRMSTGFKNGAQRRAEPPAEGSFITPCSTRRLGVPQTTTNDLQRPFQG